jgi:hypothetical protein
VHTPSPSPAAGHGRRVSFDFPEASPDQEADGYAERRRRLERSMHASP